MESGISMEEVRQFEESFFETGKLFPLWKRMGTRYLQEFLNRFVFVLTFLHLRHGNCLLVKNQLKSIFFF